MLFPSRTSFFLQSSEVTPEKNAFTLMFLYVGVQLFSDAQQAQEILEVHVYVLCVGETLLYSCTILTLSLYFAVLLFRSYSIVTRR